MTLVHDLSSVLDEKREEIVAWMNKKRSEIEVPIYGSVDIRDAGWKIAVVDANQFPAGFNNTSESDLPHLTQRIAAHIERHKPGCEWVHIYPESHTRNQGYVENLRTLCNLIERAGYKCTVGNPELEGILALNGLHGPLPLHKVEVIDDALIVQGQSPDFILLNNDLTDGGLEGLSAGSVLPSPKMGWYQRKKSQHFDFLRPLVEEVSEIIGIEPWHLICDSFVSEEKCLEKEACRIKLAEEVDVFLAHLSERYARLGIDREPVAYVKNNRGTYGLGIMTVTSGEQLLNLSNRKMKKLMYGKGTTDVEDFLIQEGVPTLMKTESGDPVEPVVYLVDGDASSWFYRVNPKKDEIGNLNSPSAHFVSSEEDPSFMTHAHNWHALLSELSMLAMGLDYVAVQQQELVDLNNEPLA
jgi:glutamate--cysteine ligase